MIRIHTNVQEWEPTGKGKGRAKKGVDIGLMVRRYEAYMMKMYGVPVTCMSTKIEFAKAMTHEELEWVRKTSHIRILREMCVTSGVCVLLYVQFGLAYNYLHGELLRDFLAQQERMKMLFEQSKLALEFKQKAAQGIKWPEVEKHIQVRCSLNTLCTLYLWILMAYGMHMYPQATVGIDVDQAYQCYVLDDDTDGIKPGQAFLMLVNRATGMTTSHESAAELYQHYQVRRG